MGGGIPLLRALSGALKLKRAKSSANAAKDNLTNGSTQSAIRHAAKAVTQGAKGLQDLAPAVRAHLESSQEGKVLLTQLESLDSATPSLDDLRQSLSGLKSGTTTATLKNLKDKITKVVTTSQNHKLFDAFIDYHTAVTTQTFTTPHNPNSESESNPLVGVKTRGGLGRGTINRRISITLAEFDGEYKQLEAILCYDIESLEEKHKKKANTLKDKVLKIHKQLSASKQRQSFPGKGGDPQKGIDILRTQYLSKINEFNTFIRTSQPSSDQMSLLDHEV
ncbi:hypothetical protein DID78_02680 [Candidatus Marinamargulisbacteria bacterium SCGC AG-343-D04]|nr:hypothetical protein DID78_02680 [Candidatus Marinamargulisbacteria bacterium SCGC AG-343-D04]